MSKGYDQCVYVCKMKFPGPEGYNPCAERCEETKTKGEKGCYDRNADCMSKCLAKPYKGKPCDR